MDLTYKQEEIIRKIVREEIRSEIESQTRLLPTKDEFFTAMSELMGEVKSMREEHTIVHGYKDQIEDLNTKSDDHEERITSLESVVIANA